MTQREFLFYRIIVESLSYRFPMRIAEVRSYLCAGGQATYPVCPRCQTTMEREYQFFCDRCGQAMDWTDFRNAAVILPEPPHPAAPAEASSG